MPTACAYINFAKRSCDIYVSRDFPPDAATLATERAHCVGFGDLGGTDFARAWERYNNAQAARKP